MKHKTDDELALLCKQGDEHAIEVLFARYKKLLGQISRGYFLLGSDQDDLMQEAMIGLYKAIVSFKQNQQYNFKNFAILCVRRSILDAIKKSNAQKHKILNDSISLSVFDGEQDETNYLFLPHSSQLTDQELEQSQVFNEIIKQIAKKLSAMEYNILKEYLKGDSYLQIANKLSISAKSVDNALSRIKLKLQFLLE